jgi:hypothetical protein
MIRTTNDLNRVSLLAFKQLEWHGTLALRQAIKGKETGKRRGLVFFDL